jgi:ABC-2 type transport system ATP-binding protein
MRPAAVEVHRLRWRRRRNVLDGLELRVPVGARLLLVSRPEEGASVLLRILAGLIRPSGGTVLLAGLSRADDSASGWARRVAYVPPEPGIYSWLSPDEALDLAGRLAGYDRGERRRRVEAATEQFRLGSGVDRPISRGGTALAEKTALAAAMLTEPEVLLLDDPLRAVDPLERARLLRLPGKRTTLLLASRFPASAAGLIDQVALLRDGRLALHAPISELERAGLPLSLRGIESLADRHGAGLPAAASG